MVNVANYILRITQGRGTCNIYDWARKGEIVKRSRDEWLMKYYDTGDVIHNCSLIVRLRRIERGIVEVSVYGCEHVGDMAKCILRKIETRRVKRRRVKKRARRKEYNIWTGSILEDIDGSLSHMY